MLQLLKREWRIAASKKAQPVWFRIAKWAVFLGVLFTLRGTAYFWLCLFGTLLLGVILHLVYRHQTQNWTRPWGGWNDLESGQ